MVGVIAVPEIVVVQPERRKGSQILAIKQGYRRL